jgi:hypothetical protein
VSLRSIVLSATGYKPLEIKTQPTTTMTVYCEALTSQGAPLTDASCFGAAPIVSGAAMSCGGA